jgi:hypothetical protein
MRTIVFTYPGFASLPRGIKQLLVTSESIFFREAKPVISKTSAIRSKVENYWSKLESDGGVALRARFGID